MSSLKSSQTSSKMPVFSRIIVISVITKVIIGAGVQVFFPFLPIIAAGMRVTEEQFGQYLRWQAIGSPLSPIFGSVADQWGYKRMISIGLFIASIGAFVIYFSSTMTQFVVGLLLLSVGGAGGNPVIGAYLSKILPFERRSRGLGILEYGWALVGILVLPVFGLLIDGVSWRTPFLVLGILSLLAIVAFNTLPTVVESPSLSIKTLNPFKVLYNFFDLGPNWRSGLAVILSSMFTMIAGLFLSYNFGTWLLREYGLSATSLGWVAFSLGFADISGSTIVTFAGDRLGKRRSVMIATFLGAIMYLFLPVWNTSLWASIVGIFLARWMFEFAIVGLIVLTSEQSPEQRGKMLSFRMALATVSTFVALTYAGSVFEQFGVMGIGVVGAICLLIACGLIRFFTVERG